MDMCSRATCLDGEGGLVGDFVCVAEFGGSELCVDDVWEC